VLLTVDESEILTQANHHFQMIAARIERGSERLG
jgi:hypothetical protein